MPTAGVSSKVNSTWKKTHGDRFKEFSRSSVRSLRWLNVYTDSLLHLLLVPHFRTVLLPCGEIWGRFPLRLSP